MSTSSTNINNTFFEGSYKNAWKQSIPKGLSEAEVDFVLDVAALKEGEKVLDIMCGYGRHALELARRGLRVTAIDNLKDYIDEIEIVAQKENLKVNGLKSDVLNTKLTETFDATICMGNSFAFFNKEDAISILKNISSHLKSGGVFILNTWKIAEIAIRNFKERDWQYEGDYKSVVEFNFCFHPSRIEFEQVLISKDNKIEETIKGVDYIFTLDELESIFNEAGLKTKNFYSTPRKRKFSIGDLQIYIVAEKMT